MLLSAWLKSICKSTFLGSDCLGRHYWSPLRNIGDYNVHRGAFQVRACMRAEVCNGHVALIHNSRPVRVINIFQLPVSLFRQLLSDVRTRFSGLDANVLSLAPVMRGGGPKFGRSRTLGGACSPLPPLWLLPRSWPRPLSSKQEDEVFVTELFN